MNESPVLEQFAPADSWCPKVHPGLIVDRDAAPDFFLLHPDQARWSLANRLRESNLLENAPVAPPPRPKKQRPPDITIYLTEQCNLRCKHCAVVEGKMPSDKLTTEDIKDLIAQHASRYEDPTISFTGGETFLRQDCMEILEFAAQHSKFVNVNTNGLLIDREMARRLAQLSVWVQVSLDGADPEVHDFIRGKGTFARAWQTVEWLCEFGGAQKVLIATTLTRCVLPQVIELIERADALSIRNLRFLTLNKLKAAVTNWDRIAPDGAEMLNTYRYLLLEFAQTDRRGKTEISASFPGFVPDADPRGGPWCPLGQTVIVDSQGDTYNCPTLRGPDFRTGNIRESSLRDIEEGGRNREMREQMLSRRFVIDECRDCAWRNFCQAGCQAFTFLRTNSLYVNDEFCDFRRELYRAHVKLQAQGQIVQKERESVC